MELEHMITATQANVMALQMLMVSALLVPAAVGRVDLYRSFVASAASYIVSFTPVTMLLYILYKISHLS
ncbi:MAG: hypothetical protein A2X56_05665 [Nitrospirae bacterium GWC2_57_13]|jgi:hypothetical protein|nr:MAG: hypothetical protein A2X56_05665 [Nitrospirae bacterium GWC2_57_13]OGW43889.1 MAG: hypothetical protein A2X57_00535 [Nitrospirae bacterium GWD2_57_8]HAR45295.1 hypothetical protein [Nitrospiraceae bacterium]HAS55545.1 hypothetical protein [Nitrospiraceae bacterium]